MTGTIACPVCGSSASTSMAHLHSPIDGRPYDAMRCGKCAHLWASPIPDTSFDHLQDVYGTEYTGDMRAPDEEPADLEALRDATGRQMEYVERYVPVGRALNVGAMSGATAVLSERGWKLHFVEVSRYAAESARARWGYDVTVTRLEDFHPAMGPFDFVKLGHVIEHIGDPREALHSVVRALRPGGVMLLDTDNAKGLRTEVEGAIRRVLGERNARALVRRVTGKDLQGRYGRLIPPVHVHIFSKASLRRLLEEAGFEIIKMRSPAWGDPTWFPLTNLRTLSLAERAFIHMDQFGALVGRGELLSVLARKR